ncbi:hypothetical protein Cal7507_4827 [Calothrix sp. PCC 7507]|nr:hypothetical protein Cal7507_4827 [Calothrix sp. PCC 7507]
MKEEMVAISLFPESKSNPFATINLRELPHNQQYKVKHIFILRLYDPFQNHIHRYQQPYSVSLFPAIQ